MSEFGMLAFIGTLAITANARAGFDGGVEWHGFDLGLLGGGGAGGESGGGRAVVVSLPGFEDFGGERELVGVDVVVETVTTLGYDFENPYTSPWVIDNVHAGWSTSVALTVGYALEAMGPGMDSGPIALGASDGVPLAGADYERFGVEGYAVTGGALINAGWVLDAFSSGVGGNAVVSAASLVVLTGAGETFVGSSFEQTGTLRLGFVYRSVPTPGGVAVAGIAACLVVVGRRRWC